MATGTMNVGTSAIGSSAMTSAEGSVKISRAHEPGRLHRREQRHGTVAHGSSRTARKRPRPW
jgi:hypothetical protein